MTCQILQIQLEPQRTQEAKNPEIHPPLSPPHLLQLAGKVPPWPHPASIECPDMKSPETLCVLLGVSDVPLPGSINPPDISDPCLLLPASSASLSSLGHRGCGLGLGVCLAPRFLYVILI